MPTSASGNNCRATRAEAHLGARRMVLALRSRRAGEAGTCDARRLDPRDPRTALLERRLAVVIESKKSPPTAKPSKPHDDKSVERGTAETRRDCARNCRRASSNASLAKCSRYWSTVARPRAATRRAASRNFNSIARCCTASRTGGSRCAIWSPRWNWSIATHRKRAICCRYRGGPTAAWTAQSLARGKKLSSRNLPIGLRW